MIQDTDQREILYELFYMYIIMYFFILMLFPRYLQSNSINQCALV